VVIVTGFHRAIGGLAAGSRRQITGTASALLRADICRRWLRVLAVEAQWLQRLYLARAFRLVRHLRWAADRADDFVEVHFILLAFRKISTTPRLFFAKSPQGVGSGPD